MTTRSCTSCAGTDLVPGFVEDRGQGSGGYARWIPGPLRFGPLGGARRLGRTPYDIEAWRCSACGHLEHYAIEPEYAPALGSDGEPLPPGPDGAVV